MDNSVMIAQIMAAVFIPFGFGALSNRKHYTKLMAEFRKSPTALYLEGMLEIVIGFIIVMKHNVWITDWMTIVTIIGWGALIEGILVLAFPAKMISISQSATKGKNIELLGGAILIIGLILGYYGFIA